MCLHHKAGMCELITNGGTNLSKNFLVGWRRRRGHLYCGLRQIEGRRQGQLRRHAVRPSEAERLGGGCRGGGGGGGRCVGHGAPQGSDCDVALLGPGVMPRLVLCLRKPRGQLSICGNRFDFARRAPRISFR
jgi:hypothetical protein